jgi:hypothetical protein
MLLSANILRYHAQYRHSSMAYNSRSRIFGVRFWMAVVDWRYLE